MKSRLYLETVSANGYTQIEDMFFTTPYKIMSPFVTGSHADITIMAASAGLLSGDEVDQEFNFRAGSDVAIHTQSYEKVFDCEGGEVLRGVRITVERDAVVHFLPYPVIPFSGSNFDSHMTVDIAKDATFICADVFSCGRIGMGEYFLMRRFRSKLLVRVDDKIAFADHTLIDPAQMNYQGLGMWRSFTHCGVLYAYFPNTMQQTAFLEKARALSANLLPDGEVGATQVVQGVCVRALGTNGQSIFDYFQTLAIWSKSNSLRE